MAVDFSGIDRAIASLFDEKVQAIAGQLAQVTPDALKSTQQAPVFNEAGTEAVITWDAPDALLIHEGFTRSDGTVTAPNRWTEKVLNV